MLFQTAMRLPIDNEVISGSSDTAVVSEENMATVIENLLQSREEAFQAASDNIKNAQKVQKETYDRKHQSAVFDVGSKVLLENTAQKQRKGGKMNPLWLGPYIISKDLGKGLYELSDSN